MNYENIPNLYINIIMSWYYDYFWNALFSVGGGVSMRTLVNSCLSSFLILSNLWPLCSSLHLEPNLFVLHTIGGWYPEQIRFTFVVERTKGNRLYWRQAAQRREYEHPSGSMQASEKGAAAQVQCREKTKIRKLRHVLPKRSRTESLDGAWARSVLTAGVVIPHRVVCRSRSTKPKCLSEVERREQHLPEVSGLRRSSSSQIETFTAGVTCSNLEVVTCLNGAGDVYWSTRELSTVVVLLLCLHPSVARVC